MSRKVSFRILVSVFLVLAVGCIVQSVVVPKDQLCEKQIFAMNTVMTFKAYGENASEAVDAAITEINRLDALLSTGREASEISVINAEGKGSISTDTNLILERSMDIYEKTQGVFDCTIYPLMKLWGFPTQEYHVPTEMELEETLMYVDASKIKVQESGEDLDLDGNEEVYESEAVVLLGEGQEIDFGGIAKGYASDRAIEIFQEHGIKSGMVSLGGNVKTLNRNTDGTKWTIGIRDPEGESGDVIAALNVENKAVVTSGGYERFFEENGETYIHILDPKTGYPAESGLVSVTIVSSDGMLADALSTALYVMGAEDAAEFWRNSEDEFEAVIITEEGEILVTEGIEEDLVIREEYRVIYK